MGRLQHLTVVENGADSSSKSARPGEGAKPGNRSSSSAGRMCPTNPDGLSGGPIPRFGSRVHNEGEGARFLKLMSMFPNGNAAWANPLFFSSSRGFFCRASASCAGRTAFCAAITKQSPSGADHREDQPSGRSSRERSIRSMAANSARSWIGLWEEPRTRGCTFRAKFSATGDSRRRPRSRNSASQTPLPSGRTFADPQEIE